MKNNNPQFYLYIIFLAVIQIIINNTFPLYVDLLGVTVVILILCGNYTLITLFFISILADLIGHWYLGTHLIAAICLSFMPKSTTNYFNISTFFHKSVTLMFMSSAFLLLIFCIDLILHNAVINITSLFLEVIIIAPLLLKTLDSFIIVQNRDLIF